MTRARPKDAIIAIIGATGTGKSQLAVELAKRYNGEIINGDAMQLYAGLPIITNKITAVEQQGVPHHLLGCIGLHEQTWVVGTFVKKATKVIDEIRSRDKLPILVGGTHYYTQSLLFKDRLPDENKHEEEREFVENTKEEWPILKRSTEELMEELKRVDPVMAERWHPNDRRKIQRSLQIYLQTDRKASDIYAQQRSANDISASLDGCDSPADRLLMRFPTLLFWVHADSEVLKSRLNDRVDKMLEQGLLDEVHTMNHFADAQMQAGKPVDETRGIWVSIGYKEFKRYTNALDQSVMDDKDLAKLKSEALESTKASTRQYAKRQIRWIRIKLVNALAQANARNSLYLLDGSDVSSYDKNVVAPAVELTNDFFTSSSPMSDPKAMSTMAADLLTPSRNYDLAATPEKWIRKECEVCGVTCVTEEQWGMHVMSKAHRKLVSKRKKVQEGLANGGHVDTAGSSNAVHPDPL